MDIELREILNKVYANEMKPDEAQWKICVLFSVSVECEHPYAYVHTRCMGEINHCIKCGKDL